MVYRFLGMFIVLPTWYQRTLTIAIVPLAYFFALFYSKEENKYLKWFLLAALILQVIIFTAAPVWWMSPPDYFGSFW